MTIAELYAERCKKPERFPDIWEHLPALAEEAGAHGHITEFGVRTGNSTIAFLHALSRNGGKLVSYDIGDPQFAAPPLGNVEWVFNKRNTADYSLLIEQTDLLFIDSCHDYGHAKKELRHAERVRHTIIMHDTSPNWGNGLGPLRAMLEFVTSDAGWQIHRHHDNCNGLTILKRR